MSEFIEFRDVRKVYKMGEVEIPALDGVSFQIKKGEFVVIAGASGAGKSTILNILGGMDTCTSGEILVDGEEVSKMDARQLTTYRRYDIGFVFQFYNLVQNLTARPAGAAQQFSLPAFRRRAAAGCDRPGAGEKSEAVVMRRTDRRAGLSNRQGNPEAFAGYLP